jgi:hypothetical protein
MHEYIKETLVLKIAVQPPGGTKEAYADNAYDGQFEYVNYFSR